MKGFHSGRPINSTRSSLKAKSKCAAFWERKGVFYAQLDANNGKQYKYPLPHAKTVSQAITEMQALKKIQREGKLFPPGITEAEAEKEDPKECTVPAHTSHRDGGVLIGRLHGHLDKSHPSKMAKKLSFHFS